MRERRSPILILALAAAVLFAAGACKKKGAPTEAPGTTGGEGKVTVLPQDSAWKDAGMLGFRVDAVKILKRYDAAFAAGEGKIYAEVEYSIRNTTDAVQTYATMLSILKLTAPTGAAYEYVPGLGNWIESQGAKDGKIAPKAEVKVSCVFEVDGRSDLKVAGWKFDVGNSDLNAPAVVSFDLK